VRADPSTGAVRDSLAQRRYSHPDRRNTGTVWTQLSRLGTYDFHDDQGGHKVGEKKSQSFPGFSRAIITLFHRLRQQKVYIIMTSIYQGSLHMSYYSFD